MPTKITSFQKPNCKQKIASANLEIVVYETMLRCAELNGYTNISHFVKDAILDKCMVTTAAMTSILQRNKVVAE
jgi:hypothetical protein